MSKSAITFSRWCVMTLGCAILLASSASPAHAQAVSPSGNENPAAQPLPGQILGTDLTLNQGVNAIAAENESFERFGFGVEASGGAITNFFGTQTDHQTAEYTTIGGHGAIQLQSSRTRFFAFYQPQYSFYPQYSQVNNFGQTAFATLIHRWTEHTAFEWNTTGARYLSLSEYLPQTLNIGGVPIVVPTGQQLLEDSFELTNAATSLHLRSILSDRMTFDGTLTSGFFLIVPKHVTTDTTLGTERVITSGADVQLNYELTPKDVIGGEITPIYIYGMRPSGHQNAETVLGIYQRQLTPTLTVKVGAGPLFIQSSSPFFGSAQDTSYAAKASIVRQLRQSQFGLSYSRAIIVNLLSPALVSNAVAFNAYLPVVHNWTFLGSANYAQDSGSGLYGSARIAGGSARAIYRLTTNLQLFAQYSFLSQAYNNVAGQEAYGFNRNQIGGGIRFNLGNPTVPGGTQ